MNKDPEIYEIHATLAKPVNEFVLATSNGLIFLNLNSYKVLAVNNQDMVLTGKKVTSVYEYKRDMFIFCNRSDKKIYIYDKSNREVKISIENPKDYMHPLQIIPLTMDRQNY